MIVDWQKLNTLRAAAKDERDPTTPDDVLAVLCQETERMQNARILEVGTGRGLTSVAFILEGARHVTTIEREETRILAAKETFSAFGVSDCVTLLEGDAAEILPVLSGEYDLVFLDCAKVQYRRFLPDCKRLLRAGGVLCADDVLLFADGVPAKRRMLAKHIEEFVFDLKSDADFKTQVLSVGKGLAVARKKDTQ